jgi:transposase InsO family protein
MVTALFPLQYVVAALSLWLSRQQQDVIDYLKEENRILKSKLAGNRISFSDAEPRRLATRAKALGRKVLSHIDTLVTPDTLLRWHRALVAQKWNFVHRRRPGRPSTKAEIVALIVRFAQANPSWVYTRIKGALSNVGHQVSRGTITNILEANGIDTAPLRGKRTQWSTFLKAHWKILVASDFFTLEVWRLRGLTTYHVWFFLDLSTRSIRIAGITANPDCTWMVQIGRNLTDVKDGWYSTPRKLITDRDTKYCAEFRALLEQGGNTLVRLPPRSPNLNAFAERFVGSIKSECLSRLIFFGEASLRRRIREYVTHYHHERNHQGLGNRIIAANEARYESNSQLCQRARLGGVLNYYYREAA